MSALQTSPELIHPSLWKGSQLARGPVAVVDTGYANLSAELPGGGWPLGALIEILTQQPGSGEVRLLAPALGKLKLPIVLIEPPVEPVAHGWAYAGLPADRLLLLRAKHTSDQLWAAEQALRAGTCSATLLWQTHARADALRRLHLAARSSASLFFVMRPVYAAADASPAELRVAVRPAEEGVALDIIKRKGPRFEGELVVNLRPGAVLTSPYGRARRAVTPTAEASRIVDSAHA